MLEWLYSKRVCLNCPTFGYNLPFFAAQVFSAAGFLCPSKIFVNVLGCQSIAEISNYPANEPQTN